MILQTECVTQTVDADERRAFVKQLVRVDGPEPLAMVRKRLPEADLPGGRCVAPVLLTHGFGQNRYAWHLSGRSFVNYLAREGFDVFNVDFRGQGRSRRLGSRAALSLDEYVRHDLPAALCEALALSGFDRALVVGHSLGGIAAYAAAPRLRASLAGLVTLGAPYRFGRGSVTLTAFARLMAALSERSLVRPAAVPVRAIGGWMRAQRSFWDSPRLPLPLRAWAPGAFEPHLLNEYLDLSFDGATLGTLAELALLANEGRFVSRDGGEDYGAAFEACDLPLLVIAGAHDMLAPPPSVRPAFERSRAPDKSYWVAQAGHADLLLGRDAVGTTWPLVARWLRAHAAQN